ncbi:hypothetical protein BDF19DRAFT_450000 [Syncephalis fuscata]|nr:hypothetical protein BDF19DRAFT_450000 [Syncephalis fuscata]
MSSPAIDIRPTTPVSSTSDSRPISPPLPPGSELTDINAFRPAATVSARCSKIKLRLFLDSNVFIAGGNIYGRMELTSATSRSLLLGEIAVELTGYEEVSCQEVTASQSFLSSRLLFQGAKVPPSNAVHGPAQKGHFWLARKGKTTFPFAFRVPSDAPSSAVFQTTASLRYVVTGVVQIFYSGQEDTVFRSKEACVMESFDGKRLSNILLDTRGAPIEMTNTRRLFFGGPGALQVTAQLQQSVFSSGQNISLMVRVRNDTRRRVQGIKVSIGHRLRIYMAGKEAPRITSQIVHESSFNTEDFSFDPGVERTAVINVAAPSKARTARQNSLFRIECYIVVACYVGAFYRDLTVEIPITLLHAASLNKPAPLDLTRNRYTNQYNLLDENAIVEEAYQSLENNEEAKDSGINDNYSRTPPIDMPSPTRRWLPWSSNDDIAANYSRTPSPTSSLPLPTNSDIPPVPASLTSLTAAADINQGRLVASSPSYAPASPINYVPARERLRYVPFRAPPTEKALDSPLRPLLYQGAALPPPSSSRPMSALGIRSNDYDRPTNLVSGNDSNPVNIERPFRPNSNPLHTSNLSSPASSAVSSVSGTPLEKSPNTSPCGTPAGSSPAQLNGFNEFMAKSRQINNNVMLTRTPPTGEGLPEICTFREENALASSLPANLNRIYRTPSPPQSPRNASPRPLPITPVKAAIDNAPNSEVSAPGQPSGISRLFQWGAASFTQLVTSNEGAVLTDSPLTDNVSSSSEDESSCRKITPS